MRRSLVFMIQLSLLVFAFSQRGNVSIAKASPTIHQGDLILTGNNVTTIEGRFDINGSIIVEGNATLILKNAIINLTQTDYHQHFIIFENPATGNPRLQSINSTTTSQFNFMIILRDNSSASISNSIGTNTLLAVQPHATAYVSDSTFARLAGQGHSDVYVYNSTFTEYMHATDVSNLFVSNSTITKLWLTSSNVNCTMHNIGVEYYNFWNYLLNCSVSIASLGSAPNLTLINTEIDNWTVDLYGQSNVTVNDSILRELSAHNSTVWFVNTTSLSIAIGPSGKILQSWYLDVKVLDSIDQVVPNANVTAAFQNATVARSGLTDSSGWIRLTLMEKMMNATGDYPTGNYTVEATYDIYSSETTANMTGNQQATLKLESFIIPEFSTLIILPLFMTLTLLVAFLFNRKHIQ